MSVFFQTLLQQGRADANAPGRNSCTPLHLAAEMDNEKICQILVRFFKRIIQHDTCYNHISLLSMPFSQRKANLFFFEKKNSARFETFPSISSFFFRKSLFLIVSSSFSLFIKDATQASSGKIRQLNFITRAISIGNKTNHKNLKQKQKQISKKINEIKTKTKMENGYSTQQNLIDSKQHHNFSSLIQNQPFRRQLKKNIDIKVMQTTISIFIQMIFFRFQIDNSGDTKSLDDDRMTPLAHAMERGAGKSAEFLLNHGTLLTTYSLLSRDYNKAYNLLLMYILNFEPVIK